MSIRDVPAIDVHGHYGNYAVDGIELAAEMLSADAATVARRAAAANINCTIVSPLSGLLPGGRASAVAGNEAAAREIALVDGLLQWVIVNPLEPASFDQADRMLGKGRCVGIKIHPDQHRYFITEHGRKVFEFAAERRAVVLTHSGGRESMPMDFIPFANEFPQVKLILAHLGGGWDDQRTYQVRAIQASLHGNVWTDTSSSKSILAGLIEWAVKEIGTDRILFGTDAPIYSTATQRARIDEAEISDRDKIKILRDNAIQLFADRDLISISK